MSSDNLKALYKKLEDLKNEIKEAAEAFIKNECEKLFKKYDKMKKFSWTQYTPYWNDGDTCECSVHTFCPSINGIEIYDGEVDNDEEEDNNWMSDASKDIKNVLDTIDQETMQDLFGDHQEITVTPKRITKTFYNHD